MTANIKILTVNLNTELIATLLSNYSGTQPTITIVDNLYSQTTTNQLDDYQLVITKIDSHTNTLEKLKSFCLSNPFIELIGVIDSQNTEQHKCIQDGIFDLITENCSSDKLMAVILKALKTQQNKKEISQLKQYVAMNFGFDNLIGDSKQMLKLKDKIKKVSPTDISVLLYGATGTGKSLTATIIHHHSERRKQPFLTLDCSTTPSAMFAQILFGSTDTNSESLLLKANNGTLFIKDIEFLPLPIQNKLIKFITTGSLETAEMSKKLSIRLISSTCLDIHNLSTSDTMNRELLQLVSEVAISVPTLTERLDDIDQLTEYFLRKTAYRTKDTPLTLTRSALELLFTHTWNENIRELETTLKRAISLCRSSQIDDGDILFIDSGNRNSSSNKFTVEMTADQGNGILDEGQRTLIIKTLNDNDWNFTQTAHELGIGRTTLWRKVKKYNLKKESTEFVG